MYDDSLKNKLQSFFSGKKSIAIVQGDNPDADSLASSLALEDLLHHRGHEPTMYCAIDVPVYLRYLNGWDRVSTELSGSIDAWILVDCSYEELLNIAENSGDLKKLKTKPLLILDHHDVPTNIDFAECIVNDINAGATGEVIYRVSKLLDWDISKTAAEFMAVSILSDTLGFTSEFMTDNSSPLKTVADLVDIGVNLAELNSSRLAQSRISPEIFRYKTELLSRIEFHHEGRIATIDIPHDEIKEHSMMYNPTVVLDDTRQIEGLAVTIGFKIYERNGSIYRITGRIRCGYGYKIANDLASIFEEGGGHAYAAGFKVEGDNLDFQKIKAKAINRATELI